MIRVVTKCVQNGFFNESQGPGHVSVTRYRADPLNAKRSEIIDSAF